MINNTSFPSFVKVTTMNESFIFEECMSSLTCTELCQHNTLVSINQTIAIFFITVFIMMLFIYLFYFFADKELVNKHLGKFIVIMVFITFALAFLIIKVSLT